MISSIELADIEEYILYVLYDVFKISMNLSDWCVSQVSR
jgi:hypothetical protein